MNYTDGTSENKTAQNTETDTQVTEDGISAIGRRPLIVIKGLSKSFGEKVVYNGFDLKLELGKFTSIFGPNGCGKSTLINMISGLMPFDSGTVLYDGMTIADTRISYVFQNYREALFPWRKAIDNTKVVKGLSAQTNWGMLKDEHMSPMLKRDLGLHLFKDLLV